METKEIKKKFGFTIGIIVDYPNGIGFSSLAKSSRVFEYPYILNGLIHWVDDRFNGKFIPCLLNRYGKFTK
jgi:hypothetical protein